MSDAYQPMKLLIKKLRGVFKSVKTLIKKTKTCCLRLSHRVSLLIIVSLALFLYYLPVQHDSYDIDIGFSDVAKENPYHAAIKFLSAKNIDVNRRFNFDFFDQSLSRNDIVLVTTSVQPDPFQQQQLLQWLNRGGTLIIGSNTFSQPKQKNTPHFLYHLGVRKVAVASDFNQPQQNTQNNENQLDPMSANQFFITTNTDQANLASCELPALDPVHIINFKNQTLQLFRDPNSIIVDTSGNGKPLDLDRYNQWITYSIGDGELIVANSLAFLENHQILYFDHAKFLEVLMNQHKRIHIIQNHHFKRWHMLIYQHFFETVCAFLLLILLYILQKRQISIQTESAEFV